MQLSNVRIQEMKDILEKDHGREFTWEEASEATHNLVGLAELFWEMWIKEKQREKKLQEHPKGFILEGIGYTCAICGQNTPENGNWYDKWGIKCTICQHAIDRKEIPASLAKNKESWYSKYDLESSFNLKAPTIRSWIKRGILIPRTVTYDGKGVHVQLFLIKDNKDTLPPKDMVKGHMVREEKENGEVWHSMHPWYHFVDPIEHLKGYKIMDYLEVTNN